MALVRREEHEESSNKAAGRMATRPSHGTGGSAVVVEAADATAQPEPQVLTLRLQGRQRLTWADDVVDNEFMNKKRSNRC